MKSTRAGSVTLQQYLLKPSPCKKLMKVFIFIFYLIFFILLRYTSMFFRLAKLGFSVVSLKFHTVFDKPQSRSCVTGSVTAG